MASQARGTLRGFMSRIRSVRTGASAADTLILGSLTLTPAPRDAGCAYFAAHYGYWRPDTRAYLGSPHNDFEYNQLWLLPPFFHLLRRVPQFTAWLVAVFLFGWPGYRIARAYLAGSPYQSRALSIGLAWMAAISRPVACG